MSTLRVGDDTFESGCDLVDVTSLHRPDTAWRRLDASGHEHRWYMEGAPADSYQPMRRYDVPSIVWVRDGWRYDEDGERYAVGHHECRTCGERIEPGYTADTHRQYAPGLRWCRINGVPVSDEEFQRRLAERHAS